MDLLNHQQLSCPHLLSEDCLRVILKDKCITLPDLELMDKPKLIELFKRVALPLPQRKYHVDRPVGKILQDMRVSRNITIGDSDENNHRSTAAEFSDNDKRSDKILNGRLKSPIDGKTENKRIRLSSTEKTVDCTAERETKRKCDKEGVSQSQSKKRQKITWP